MSGAGNQQERLFIEAIPTELGSFLAGFALGEASFMIVCRNRQTRHGGWRISAAFNVSQHDRARSICSGRRWAAAPRAEPGNGGWYWEANRLSDIQDRIVPFFERFPLLGSKAEDFRRFTSAVRILARGRLSPSGYAQVLALREGMNRGGKRRHSMTRILRDYTPNSPAEQLAR